MGNLITFEIKILFCSKKWTIQLFCISMVMVIKIFEVNLVKINVGVFIGYQVLWSPCLVFRDYFGLLVLTSYLISRPVWPRCMQQPSWGAQRQQVCFCNAEQMWIKWQCVAKHLFTSLSVDDIRIPSNYCLSTQRPSMLKPRYVHTNGPLSPLTK